MNCHTFVTQNMDLFSCNICFVIFVVLFGIIYCLHLYWENKFNYWQRNGVELVEEPSFPFGHFWPFLKASKPLNVLYHEVYKKVKGPFGGLYLVNQPALMLKDPEIIKQILVKDFNYFTDRGMHCNEEKEPLSGHLFRLNGKSWKTMRSKLSPAFTIGKLKMMFETLDKNGQTCEDNLQHNTNVDITDHTLKFTADCIASIIFGLEVNSFENKHNFFWNAVDTLLNKVSYTRFIIFIIVQQIPKLIEFLGIKTLYNKSNEQIFEVVKDVVSYREKNKVFRKDFMQLMIQLKNQGEVNQEDSIYNTYEKSQNSKEGMSIYKISASVYSMFFAGFDTSASTITYCLYQLALNPEIQDRVIENIDRSLAKHDGRVTYESVMEMTYLEMVINETLRMYPILGYLQRQAIKDFKVPNSNLVIKKGVQIYISLLGLHYDPENFPNPDKFIPERFSHENKAKIRPYTYMPFGEGPRNCIGKKLGLIMSTVGVVWFLKKHRLEICEETIKDIKYRKYYLAHVPDDHIVLKVVERSPNYNET